MNGHLSYSFDGTGKAAKSVPAFLGYIVPEGVSHMADRLVSKSLLPVALDLDETLLVANSESQLMTQIAKANAKRYTPSCQCLIRLFLAA